MEICKASQQPDVMEAAVTYLILSVLSFPMLAVYNSVSALFCSMSRTQSVMNISILMNVLNVVGNAIGIFVLHAGVAGVAVPSLISRTVAAVIMLILVFDKKNFLYLCAKEIFMWNETMLKRILGIAVPNGIENGLYLHFRYASVTADAGYESEEAYDYLESHGQKPYIKPQTYEKWKKRSFKKDISKRENMKYDSENDVYTCHAQRLLYPLYKKKQRGKNEYESEATVYECSDCNGCPHKDKCTRAKGNKRLYVSKNFIDQRQASYENIMSQTGVRYRMNRSIQVEGAFGVLKNDYNFQRFLLRGKTKIKFEILLLCLGYNINKLHAKIQNDRLGSHLFPVKTA